MSLISSCDYARAKFHQLEAYKIAYEVDKEVKAMWAEIEAVKWE